MVTRLISKKTKILFTFFALALCINISKADPTDTTKVGIYITSIYDLDYINNAFSAQYWVWRLNTKNEFKEYNLFEAANAKETKKLLSSIDYPDQTENVLPSKLKGDTLFWDYENFSSIIRHDYDITNYPFDNETLVLEFENTTYYDDWVKLKIDEKASGHGNLKINGWEIGEMQIKETKTTYESTFGSPGDKGFHSYSGFKVLIPIKREGGSLFVKLFSGLFVALVIALFSLRINIAEADGRFGVCVGALFAALANMYIVNSNLPLVSKFTFMDKAHILTIVLILILFIASTFSLKYYKADKLKKSKKVDLVVGIGVIAIYIIGMISIWP